MKTATVWNKESTNYGANRFVKMNGTGSFEVDSEAQAMRLLSEAIHNPAIDRLDLELEDSTIVWVRNSGPVHECRECDECDCQGDSDELEQFRRDTEDNEDDWCDRDSGDIDLNDPRR